MSSDTNVAKLPAEEAAAVAEAVGLPRHFQHAHTGSDSKLSMASSNAEEDNKDGTRAETPQQSPEIEDEHISRVLKSPGLGNLESPPESESESETESRGRDRSFHVEMIPPVTQDPNKDEEEEEEDEEEEELERITSKLQLADAS